MQQHDVPIIYKQLQSKRAATLILFYFFHSSDVIVLDGIHGSTIFNSNTCPVSMYGTTTCTIENKI